MGPQIPVSPSPLPQTPHTAKPRLGWGDAQARGGARSRGPPWGPPWGRVDTNDLHTAALRRRPAAGGPRLWGSVLQGSQRTEVSNACPNQPLPRHAPGHAAAATLPSRPPQSLSWGRTSEAGSLNGWEGGPFPQSGALRRVVGCSPWLGDVGCRWFGGLMQKAGEGGEETTEEGSTMRGWVGRHPRDLALEKGCLRAGKEARGCQEGGLLLTYP